MRADKFVSQWKSSARECLRYWVFLIELLISSDFLACPGSWMEVPTMRTPGSPLSDCYAHVIGILLPHIFTTQSAVYLFSKFKNYDRREKKDRCQNMVF